MSSSSEESPDDGPDIFRKGVRQRLSDPTKKVAQTKEILSKQAVQTKKILSKQVVKIAKQAEEHERFINKVTHLLGVLGFGGFCFLLGSRPQDIPYVYCLFYVTFVPLRWIYYRYKKWHYYLLDFCYYANTIFIVMLLFYPRNEKLFLVCFSFAEGPLAWALIIWRCSLVFSSVDKIVSVLIHLLPGIVFFTIRWWDPATSADMHPEGKASGRAPWPYVEDKSYLWMWLFAVPLAVYTLWQLLYFLIVNVLRRQRLLRDPEVMTSYRELSKKAQKANSIWWRLSGLLGDQNRMVMYILLQAAFTVATMALTVPIFFSYKMHFIFQILKVSASIWNGGSFLLEVMPRQVVQKEKRKLEMKPIPVRPDQSTEDAPLTNSCNTMEVEFEMKSLPVQPDKSTVDSLTNNCDSAKVVSLIFIIFRMAPKTFKGKEPAGSSSRYNTERFNDAESAELFKSNFINRTVIFERIVVNKGIGNTGFMQCIRLNRLMTLSNLTNECFEDWVREFYCNMFDVNNTDFKTFVRGKILSVDVDTIATLLDLTRPACRTYPFGGEVNPVIMANQVASVLCGRPIVWNSPILKISELTTDYRLLNTFVCHNIEPRGHKSDLLPLQAFLLYSLGTGNTVDIPLTIFESMIRVSYDLRKITLPFGAMICRLMINAGCQAYSHEMSVSKRQTIDSRTMAMSDTHVRRRLQGEQAQVQADDAEADAIENRISTIENAVFDQSVQIEHLEERVTTGFSDIRNQLTEMFNQLRHHQ